jgi:hypothetical protein
VTVERFTNDEPTRSVRGGPADLFVDHLNTVVDAVNATDPQGAYAEYPRGYYDSVQDAIDDASADGGGVVRLPAGPTPVSDTLEMKSGVVLSGPKMEWAVWGYDSEPSDFHTAWLEADGSAGSVVEFGTLCVTAGLRNLLVKANGRTGVNLPDSATRGGNALRKVYVHDAGTYGVYAGQRETHMENVLVMSGAGDGVHVAAQDCTAHGILVGYNAGRGFYTGPSTGPIRLYRLDAFFNDLQGLELNGHGHILSMIQTDHNGRQGVLFKDVTSTLIHGLQAPDNGREYTGSGAFTTRYPDVEFAHSTASNAGCGIIGGAISSSDAKQSSAVVNSEAVVSFPELVGVRFVGPYNAGAAFSALVSPYTNFNIRACTGMPDMHVGQAGVGNLFRKVSAGVDIITWTNGSGTGLGGVQSDGGLYQPVSAQTLGSNGAVTLNAQTGNTFAVTLQANATSSSITNPKTGQHITIEWIQDGTGSRTYAWPTNCKFAGGAAPSASTTAAWRDSVTFRYDGTNWYEVSRSVGVR